MATTLPGLSDSLETSVSLLKNKNTDFPRLLAVLNDSEMLVMTNEGYVVVLLVHLNTLHKEIHAKVLDNVTKITLKNWKSSCI